MKKYLLIAVAAVLMTGSCLKNTAEVSVIDDDNAAPEAVLFGSNILTVKSKASGGIDEWNASQKLYIYGYDRDQADFTKTAFIKNAEALSPDSGMKGEIKVYEKKDVSLPYYYSGNIKYDFYGYYIDDAADTASVVKEQARIYIPFKIDGGQDLMIAKADQNVDIIGTAVKDQKDAYSAYSARRGVHPTLKFEHQLSRFVFNLIGGGENYSKIKVESITLTSKTSGNLVIAGESRGIVDAADYSALYLKEKDEATGKLVTLGTKGDVVPSSGAPERIGESLLVIPGEDEYLLTVNLVQGDEKAHDVYHITPSIVTPPVTSFEKGKQYNVTITVYGLEDVRIIAELTAWDDKAGDIRLDPDDPTTWKK